MIQIPLSKKKANLPKSKEQHLLIDYETIDGDLKSNVFLGTSMYIQLCSQNSLQTIREEIQGGESR